ncbi:MAG: methyltransferase, partial [Desulfobacterales bacterium]|nr:methyltransferase [Desulfobacterales bacterium]
PHTILTIYCLKGIVSDNHTFPESTFIGNWIEDGHSFLFFLEPEKVFISTLLEQHTSLELLDTYTMSYKQWQGGSIEPIKVGRFILNPPWIKAVPGDDEVAITLDPGLVFGNGTHPTTLACLQAIEIAYGGGMVASMLDLGTGSGILALAAARLGCQKIIAVDYNQLAARTAKRNVELNSLQQNILIINGRAEHFTAIASDLLVANIGYDVMRNIINSGGFLKQKWFVLSGILPGEAESIVTILENKPVIILKHWRTDQLWQTILGITEDGI